MLLRSPPVAALMVVVAYGGQVAWATEAACPTQAAITAELERLSGGEALGRLGRSEVTVEGRTMRVVLRDSGGQVLGVRELEAPRECRQRAAVAAVVLAAWAHDWDSPPLSVAPAVAPAAPARWRAELGLQGGAHYDGTRMAPGATVQAGWQLSGPFSAGATAGFVTARERDLGPGAVGYSLVRAGVGLVYRARSSATWFDAGLFPLIVRLGITPRALPAARAVALWTGALEGRFRLGLTWGSIMPFVSGSLGRRFVRDRVTLEDVPESADISPWDLQLGIGIAVRLGGMDP